MARTVGSIVLVAVAFAVGASGCTQTMPGGPGFGTSISGAADDGSDGGNESEGSDGSEDGADDQAPDPGESSAADDAPAPDLGGDSGGSSSGADPDTGGAPDISACSEFADVQQMLEWVNDQRGSYGGEPPYLPHERWKGIPWQGEYHDEYTFSIRFDWDDELAATAQAEAEALAAGNAPAGALVDGQNGQNRPHWIDGLNTADWRISAAEHPGDFDQQQGFGSYKPWALDISNGSARMSLHYHDFGGDGPAIHRAGVGAAADASCVVWWVIQFGP